MIFVVGNRYNWYGQADCLIYLGPRRYGATPWHQFSLVEKPDEVWCEVLESDLQYIVETKEN